MPNSSKEPQLRKPAVVPMSAWHQALRWLLFLPAGCGATGLAQALIRLIWWWEYHAFDFWCPFWVGEHFVAAAEPLAFLAAALWVLPRFRRTFTLLLAAPYCGFQLLFIVNRIEHSVSPWRDGSEAAISLVSCICSAIYFVRHYGKTDHVAGRVACERVGRRLTP